MTTPSGLPIAHLQKYVDYIHNTGITLTTAQFDEDWEPIGPTVRRDLMRAGLCMEDEGYIIVRSTEAP